MKPAMSTPGKKCSYFVPDLDLSEKLIPTNLFLNILLKFDLSYSVVYVPDKNSVDF